MTDKHRTRNPHNWLKIEIIDVHWLAQELRDLKATVYERWNIDGNHDQHDLSPPGVLPAFRGLFQGDATTGRAAGLWFR